LFLGRWEPAQAGLAGGSPPGAAFSRQPADFYTALEQSPA